jgi:hypothetical protein
LLTQLQVFVSNVEGFVPPEIVRCGRELLECLYRIRADEHDDNSLAELAEHERLYVQLREIFRTTGVREDFNLPRQHGLFHFLPNIKRFGSANGLCTTLTESKHRKVIKEPWRRSSHYEALLQMLKINSRLDQIKTCAVAFRKRGQLKDSLITWAMRQNGEIDLFRDLAEANEALPFAPVDPVLRLEGDDDEVQAQLEDAAAAAASGPDSRTYGEDEEGIVDGISVTNTVALSRRRGEQL